jgi:hypothetical protein
LPVRGQSAPATGERFLHYTWSVARKDAGLSRISSEEDT